MNPSMYPTSVEFPIKPMAPLMPMAPTETPDIIKPEPGWLPNGSNGPLDPRFLEMPNKTDDQLLKAFLHDPYSNLVEIEGRGLLEPGYSIDIGGKQLNIEQISNISRAPNNSSLTIKAIPGMNGSFIIEAENPELLNRPTVTKLFVDPKTNEIHVVNEGVRVRPGADVKGLGLVAFERQLEEAYKLGAKTIVFPKATQGDGGLEISTLILNGANGKLSMQASLQIDPKSTRQLSFAEIRSNPELKKALTMWIPNPTEVMSISFSTDPNSSERQFLNEKNNKLGSKSTTPPSVQDPSPTPPGSSGIEPQKGYALPLKSIP